MIDALPSIIQRSVVEVLNILENDKDNRFSRKLSRYQDSLSITRQMQFSRQNAQQSQGRQRSHSTVKPVKRRRKKRKSHSRKRHTRFLENRLAFKPGLASPEGKCVTAVPSEQDSDHSLFAIKNCKISVLLVVVTGIWCLRKIRHQPQLLIMTSCTNRRSFVNFWTPLIVKKM